jgi:predicted secreted protein
MNMSRFLVLCGACFLVFSPLTWGGDVAPQGVLNMSASATTEVNKDVLSVQQGLKKALDAALAEAKKVAKPVQLEVRTGGFSLSPRYTPKGGGIQGWQGSAELVVEGQDIPGIAKLTGQITTLSIARVGSMMSREQREKVESEVASQAIARYRAKALDVTRQFGYGSFTVREVTVDSQDPTSSRHNGPMTLHKPMAMSSADALPVELGKGVVTVNVTGTIQMVK